MRKLKFRKGEENSHLLRLPEVSLSLHSYLKLFLPHLNNERQECKTGHVKRRVLVGGEG
jgi:hypothetical protein